MQSKTPEKIFNASLHRSGTQSFAGFCRAAGLKVQHWPGYRFDTLCAPALPSLDGRYVWDRYRSVAQAKDVFADLPVPFVYRYAYESYPAAHFLIITRPVSDWVKSVRRHAADRDLDVMEKIQYWNICSNRKNRLSNYTDFELGKAYMEHEKQFTGFMKKHNAAFSILRLQDPGIGDQLRSLIGIQDKHIEFMKIDASMGSKTAP